MIFRSIQYALCQSKRALKAIYLYLIQTSSVDEFVQLLGNCLFIVISDLSMTFQYCDD